LGGSQEFHCFIREANKAHKQFSMAAHEARWLELTLDVAKAAIATSEGETAAAQVATVDT
jgi:hypothetical protein